MNVGIEVYIEIITPFEKQMTYTDHELSMIYKLVILKFMNTCFVPLLSYAFDDDDDKSWFKEHGLIEEITFLIILMNAGETLRVIFNILYFLKIAQRKLILWKREKSTVTQLQANEAFENEEIEIYMTLSVVLVFVFSILFFAPIIPGLSIFGIIGSIIIYWVYKILILRRLTIKKSFSSKLLIYCTNILKYAILLNGIMGFCFFNFITDDVSRLSILSLIFSILFVIIPFKNKMIKYFVKEVDRNDGGSYSKNIRKFKHYDILNPVTKAQGQSRLDGHSLRDAIIRAMIKILERKIDSKENDYQLNNVARDGFGVDGLDTLLASQDTIHFRKQRSRRIRNTSETGLKNDENENHKIEEVKPSLNDNEMNDRRTRYLEL